MLVSLTEAYLRLSDAAQFRMGEAANHLELRDSARATAALGHKLDSPDPRLFLVSVDLELREFASDRTKRQRIARLRTAEEMLRKGLNVALTTETPSARPSDKEQRTAALQRAARAKLQWLLVDVLYSIAAREEGEAAEVALDAANTAAGELNPADIPQPLIELAEARRALVTHDVKDAQKRLETLRNSSVEGTEVWRRSTLLLAECYQTLGKPGAMLDLYRVAATSDPTYPAVLQWEMGQAAALIELFRFDEAVSRYVHILNQAAVSEARERLIETQLLHLSMLPAQRRNWIVLQNGPVLPLPERTAKDQSPHVPDDARLAVLMHEYAYLRALTENQLFGTTQNEVNQTESVRYLALAEQVLDIAEGKFPNEPQIAAAKVFLAARRFDVDLSQRVLNAQLLLQKAVKDMGDRAEFRLAAINCATLFPAGVADPMLEDAGQRLDGLTVDDRYQILQAVARSLAAAGKIGEALETWESAALLEPFELRPHTAVLELLLTQAEQSPEAVGPPPNVWNAHLKSINQIEGNSSDGPYYNVYEARRLVLETMRNKTLREDPVRLKPVLGKARNMLESAEKARNYWSVIPRILGGVATIEGNNDLATFHFEKAIALGDRSKPVLTAVLAEYQKQSLSLDSTARTRAEENAVKLLDLIRSQNEEMLSGDIGRIAREIMFNRGQIEQAIGLGNQIADQTPEDKIRSATFKIANITQDRHSDRALALGLEGLSKEQLDEVAAAETLLKEATGMKPDSPDGWLALVTFYVRTGRVDLAKNTISEMLERLPASPEYVRQFASAWSHDVISSAAGLAPAKAEEYREIARTNYEVSLKSRPDDNALKYAAADFFYRDNRSPRSLQLLNGILQSGKPMSDAALAQATIAKAGTLAASGLRKDVDQALALLKSYNFPDPDWRVRALRVRRLILDRRNGPGDRRELISVLKTISDLTILLEVERFQLARLLELEGDWDGSKRHLEKLISDHPTDAFLLMSYVRALIRHAAIDKSVLQDAAGLMTQLEALEPKSFRTQATKCRLLAAQGNSAEGARILQQFVLDRSEGTGDVDLLDQLEEEHLQAAIDNLSRLAATLNDTAAEIELDRARQAMKGKRKQEAIDILRTIPNVERLEAEMRVGALRQAATLLEELKESEGARILYTAYSEKSKRPDAVLELARFLGRMGDERAGLELCEAHSKDIGLIEVSTAEIALLRHADIQDPIADQIAERIEGQLQQTMNTKERISLITLLADVRDHQQRYDEVKSLYEQVLSLDAGHVIAKNNLAFLLASRNEAQRALELIDSAIESIGPHPELLDTKGHTLLALGRAQDAVDTFLGLASDSSASSQFHLALAQLASGNPIDARQTFAKARRIGLERRQVHPLERTRFDELLKVLGEELSALPR